MKNKYRVRYFKGSSIFYSMLIYDDNSAVPSLIGDYEGEVIVI
jgi:hypothetical protein